MRRTMPFLIAGCVALAALSLLLPSDPSFDPWAWIVWGREMYEFELDTTAGPSWKPGTVFFTSLFGPLGEISQELPPALWLIVARAGGLLALVLGFRLAWRLARGEREKLPWQIGLLSGVVAAAALFTLPLWLRYLMHGNEAPLAVALMLWAVERHLDSRRDHAVVLLWAACLIRPEVFPFLVVETVIAWRSEPERRLLFAGLYAALPVLWLGPEWVSSGKPLDAARQATSEPARSLSLAAQPWRAAVERAHDLSGTEIELAALAGVASALLLRERATLALAGVTVAWLALISVMTEFGFSGANRYFLPALVAGCLLAGVGVARAVAGAGWLGLAAARRLGAAEGLRRTVSYAAAALAALALTLALAPFGESRADDLSDQYEKAEEKVNIQAEFETLLDRAGGRDEILRTGAPRFPRHFLPHAAWNLRVGMGEIKYSNPEGLILRLFRRKSAPPPPDSGFDEVARSGHWVALRQVVSQPSSSLP